MGEFIRDRLPDPVSYFEAEGLSLTGLGKWKTTRCDLHGGSDSLRVNTASGGWCCMACGIKGGDVLAFHMERHGMEFIEASQSLGAWDETAPRGPTPLRARSFSARAAVEVLRFEALLCCVAACNVVNGVRLTDADLQRLTEAAARIDLITEDFA